MLPLATACLDDNDLQAFAAGFLIEPHRDRVECHLRRCSTCMTAVAAAMENMATAADQLPDSTLGARVSFSLIQGEIFGRFRIEGILGRGGWGKVYRAEDTELGRAVAIKIMSPTRSTPGATRALASRLRTEARAMARLAHPNVVTLYDVGSDGERAFVVMELVTGGNLRQWLRDLERSYQEVLRVFIDAGRGLVAAHAVGIVHRDFKPENVLLGADGRARVTDFGLARTFDSLNEPLGAAVDSPKPQTTTLAGTPAYMAPEQILGRATNARTDQFSFCIALFIALYGFHPFLGRPHRQASSEELLRATLLGIVHEPALGAVPTEVLQALKRGLSSDPAERYGTLSELLGVLESARAAPLARRSFRWALAPVAIASLSFLGWFARPSAAPHESPAPTSPSTNGAAAVLPPPATHFPPSSASASPVADASPGRSEPSRASAPTTSSRSRPYRAPNRGTKRSDSSAISQKSELVTSRDQLLNPLKTRSSGGAR